MRENILENMLVQEIRNESKVFAGFFSGAIFALSGLAVLMARHIMHKAVGACVIGLFVFGLAAISYAVNVLRMRRLLNSALLSKTDELKSVRFNYQLKGKDFALAKGETFPVAAKKVQMHLTKQNGEAVNMRLPTDCAGKLQQAIRQYFPAIQLN